MATLQELMAECFGDSATESHKGIAKEAASSSEIDEVLFNLGLDGAETIKVASETTEKTLNETGGNMGLMDIYEEIMTDGAAAGDSGSFETAHSDASSQMGELVGEYFNVMAAPYFDKIAAEEGYEPMGDLEDAEEAAPHVPVNHKPVLGKAIDTATGGTSPYSMKNKALIKQILMRARAGEVGNTAE